MTQLHVHAVCAGDTPTALALLDAELPAALAPRMVFVFYGCEHDDRHLHRHLRSRYPDAALLGGTSSGGVMTHRGVLDRHSVGVLLVEDDAGEFGVAAAPLGDDPAATAKHLLLQALADAGCSGQLPELIWIYQAPGREEAVIEGLRRVVGDRWIVGGSSADDDLAGRWRQLGPEGPMQDGLVVGVLLPSSPMGCAFQGGYEPAGPSGIVTGIGYRTAGHNGVVTATTGREIVSIDEQPAAEIYNRWTGGRIAEQLARGGPVLAETSMCPIAIDAGLIDGVSHFLLIHPESVGSGGTLRTFSNLEVGSRIHLMTGDRARLVDRAGRVVAQALRKLPPGHGGAAGALVVYCGGCRLAVGDEVALVRGAVVASLGAAPFIGCFTFGEQGHLLGRNVHGNLMISAVVFSR